MKLNKLLELDSSNVFTYFKADKNVDWRHYINGTGDYALSDGGYGDNIYTYIVEAPGKSKKLNMIIVSTEENVKGVVDMLNKNISHL